MFIRTWEIELHIKHSAYLVRNYSDLVTALSPRCNLALLAWCRLQKLAAQSIRCKWDQGDIGEWWPSGSKKLRPVIGLWQVDWFQTFCWLCISGLLESYCSFHTARMHTAAWNPGRSLTAMGHLAERAVSLTQCPRCPMVHLPLVSKTQIL